MKKELKTVGLIYTIIILIGMYFNSEYRNNKKLEMMAKAIVVFEKQEERITMLEESVQGMNEYVETLEDRISDMEELDTILKDLSKSWSSK